MSKNSDFDLSDVIKALNKQAGSNIAGLGHDASMSDIKGYISTGCTPLDAILGRNQVIAGVPSGRIIQIYGQEAHGKSTLATSILVSAQQGRGVLLDWEKTEDENGRIFHLPKVSERKMKPGVAIRIDSEWASDKSRDQAMGLDLSKLISLEPRTLEDGFHYIKETVKKVKEKPYFQDPSVPVVIVWDTIDAVPTENQKEKGVYADGMASAPRKIKQALRDIGDILSENNITLIFVNQAIANIGGYGTADDTGCGRAIKYWASLRLHIRRSGKFDLGGDNLGINSTVKLVKSKICRPNQEVKFPIRHDTGIDDDYAILEYVDSPDFKDDKVISKAGAWYTLNLDGKEIKFQLKNWSKTISENPEIIDYLKSKMIHNG